MDIIEKFKIDEATAEQLDKDMGGMRELLFTNSVEHSQAMDVWLVDPMVDGVKAKAVIHVFKPTCECPYHHDEAYKGSRETIGYYAVDSEEDMRLVIGALLTQHLTDIDWHV